MHSAQYLIAIFFSGWLMGSVYDIYNTISGSSKWLRWVRPTLDIIFWIGSAIFVFHLTLITDSGRFRLYTLFVLVIGGFFYRMILHRMVVGSAFAMVRFVRYMLLLIWRLFEIMIWRPLRFLLEIGIKCAQLLYRLGCHLEDGAVWFVSWLLRIIFFPLSSHFKATRVFWVKIYNQWEGIWNRLSNVLRDYPKQM